MKVRLQNFQPICNAELEFPVGITVIQGPNGQGKSTIFRAINAIVTNPSGCSYYIKHGTEECSVNLQTDNEDITWVRTPSSSTYINNKTGEKYLKSSKLDLFDVSNGMGFYLDPKGRVVNIHGTWSVLFPYGETDTDLFKLFEDMFDISCSTSVLSEIKNDEQQTKLELKAEEDHLYNVNNYLSAIETSLSQINIDEIDKIISDTSYLKSQLEILLSDFEIYKSNCVYSNISMSEITIDFDDITKLSYDLNSAATDLNEYVNNNLYTNVDIPQIPETIIDIQPIDEIILDYNCYKNTLSDISNIDNSLYDVTKQLEDIQGKIDNIKVCPTCGKPL